MVVSTANFFCVWRFECSSRLYEYECSSLLQALYSTVVLVLSDIVGLTNHHDVTKLPRYQQQLKWKMLIILRNDYYHDWIWNIWMRTCIPNTFESGWPVSPFWDSRPMGLPWLVLFCCQPTNNNRSRLNLEPVLLWRYYHCIDNCIQGSDSFSLACC